MMLDVTNAQHLNRYTILPYIANRLLGYGTGLAFQLLPPVQAISLNSSASQRKQQPPKPGSPVLLLAYLVSGGRGMIGSLTPNSLGGRLF
jgi:hypothetical protein